MRRTRTCLSSGEPIHTLPLTIRGTASHANRTGKGTLDVTVNLPAALD